MTLMVTLVSVTRWATRCYSVNSHPHQSNNERFTLVHNGVIENYEELKVNIYQM